MRNLHLRTQAKVTEQFGHTSDGEDYPTFHPDFVSGSFPSRAFANKDTARVRGIRLRVQGLGFRVKGSAFGVWDLGFRA